MLGEKKIVGNKYVKISAENKFRLPAFTGAEVGDEVIVTYMPTLRKLVIGRQELEDKMYETYNKIISLKNLPAEEKRKLLRTIFGTLSYNEILNSSKEIIIPKKVIESNIFQGQGYLVGNEHLVEVYPSEEDYIAAQRNR